MRRLAPILAIAALALVGCTSSAGTEPEPEQTEAPASPPRASAEDEAAYLEKLVASMPPGADSEDSRAAVLEMGYQLCDSARASGGTTADAAQALIDNLDPDSNGWMLMMGTALLSGEYSGEYLCPEQG